MTLLPAAATAMRGFRRRACLAVSVLAICGFGCDSRPSGPTSGPVVPSSFTGTSALKSIRTPEDEELLKKLCLQCHFIPAPDTLTKADWELAITRMVQIPGYGKVIAPRRIDTSAVSQWFQERAPESLILVDRTQMAEQPPPLRRVTLSSPQPDKAPFVSQVKWNASASRGGLLTCDMRHGWLCETASLRSDEALHIFCREILHPCRLEPVDLDADGMTDYLVASLGSFAAIDHNLGTVDWLRPKNDGWERVVLALNLGRVADLKPFDYDADGDLDIAVAEFGWRTTGHVLLLENTTRKSGKPTEPKFEKRTLDERHGAVQVEINDLDANGRPDVISLLTQEHEILIAYLSQPDGSFQPRELFRAPHPVWGYSGFQLVDLDGDLDLDVLLTNGDMLDSATLKPYHSVTWLENVGELTFTPHTLAELPGAHRAEAADLDGDGDLDIVACTLLPAGFDVQNATQNGSLPPALIWLEQTSPGRFDFHVWKHGPGYHPTLTTGDFDGDGKADVALGVAAWDKGRTSESGSAYLELWLSGEAP